MSAEGYYKQNEIKHPMIFENFLIKHLIIQGFGHDYIGVFDIEGEIDLFTNTFYFIK